MTGRRYESAAVVAVCDGGRLVGILTVETLLAAPPDAAMTDVARLGGFLRSTAAARQASVESVYLAIVTVVV